MAEISNIIISLADENDIVGIKKYDSHIPDKQLCKCVSDNLVYTLKHDNVIVAVMRYSLFWETIPFLNLIFLDENYRRKGYGSRMMTYWENEMRKNGYTYVMISTQEDETAKFFYEKIGYKQIGSFLPPKQSADELIYIKEL